MTNDALIAVLDEHGPTWARRATARVLENPFWAERFGERATQHSHDDGQYHVRYLVLALRLDAPELFTEYACWLRDVLVARHMCSRHLALHFDAFAEEITAAAVLGGERAVAVLGAGTKGLRARAGVAGRVDALTDETAVTVAAQLCARRPDHVASYAAEQRCVDDVAYHLSYLADAAAAGRSAGFVAYTRFIAGFLARRGIEPIQLDACLDELGVQLRRSLDDEHWQELAPLLRDARSVIS